VANSYSTATNWLFNMIVCMTFLTMTSSTLGQVITWAMYCCFGVVSWFWVYALLPETKGKSLGSILKQFK
jgi:membrane associated rhomboid family serine protease